MSKALIVVDVQKDFCEGGALAVPKADEIVPIINEIIEHLDDGFIVVATKDYHPKDHVSFFTNHENKKCFEKIKLKNNSEQVLWPPHCIEKTNGAKFHPKLNLGQNFAIIVKGTNKEVDSYSGFFDNNHEKETGLNTKLFLNDIKEVFVCGLATDYCVKATVLDALHLGYKVGLVLSACRGVEANEGDTQRAIDEMLDAGATITRVVDLKMR